MHAATVPVTACIWEFKLDFLQCMAAYSSTWPSSIVDLADKINCMLHDILVSVTGQSLPFKNKQTPIPTDFLSLLECKC